MKGTYKIEILHLGSILICTGLKNPEKCGVKPELLPGENI